LAQGAVRTTAAGNAIEVLAAFTRLGLTSFGGPIAHLGYFREEFVARRQWLDDHAYADLVALCQLLPGPASSQVGISLGLFRAGYLGALAAWVGFTLPSALALVLFAYGVSALGDLSGVGWIHGLKVAAVAVVAQAVLGMMRTLAPDRERATLAVAGAAIVLLVPTVWGQLVTIAFGGLIGVWQLRAAAPANHVSLPWAWATPRERRFSRCSSCSWWACRSSPRRRNGRRSSCSTRSTARARWCSAAAMSCCRCCRLPWCRPAG
jgi:chromate transporter